MQNSKEVFSILELAPAFELDETVLEKHYGKQVRRWHPDQFPNPSDKKKAAAQMAAINEAFDILKNPVGRARAILALEGIATDPIDMQKDPELLEEIFLLKTQPERIPAQKKAACAAFQQAFLRHDSAGMMRAYLKILYMQR